MFLPARVTFGHDWADAAATVADVLRLELVAELAWPPLANLPWLARNPDHPGWYQLRRPLRLPRRVLGPAADLPRVRRVTGALQYLQRVHGPVDLLHAHFYPSARYFPAVQRSLDIPYVVTEHSTALTLESPDKVVTQRGLRVAARVYRDAACVMPVSQSLLEAIQSLGLTGRFKVVTNPVDADLFAPASRDGCPDRIELITVARLAKVKGLDVLLRAFAACRSQDRRLHLTIVGEGPLETELRAIAASLGVDEAVHFTGRRERRDIAVLHAESDVFVLASRAENLPVALIEAMMSGLPVVATRVGGVPELVSSARGRLVNRDDPEALAVALRQTVAELPMHDRVAAAAEARARYSMAATARALAETYREATAQFQATTPRSCSRRTTS
jgi:glycosyltransferase involved in cell wall biosynthesis